MMGKTLADVKSALESVDDGAELYTAVVAAVDAERTKGVESRSQANNEARGLRERLRPLEDAVKAMGLSDGADLQTWVAETRVRLDAAGGAADKDAELLKIKTDLAKLTASFDTVNADLGKANERAATLRTRARTNAIKARLSDALKDKVYGPDLLISALIAENKVSVADDDTTVVFKDGDTDVAFDTGLSALLEARKDIVKSAQRPGGGSNPNPGGGGSKSISRADFEALASADKMQHVKDGGEVHD